MFITSYIFNIGVFYPKFSIIALYHQLIPPSRKQMRIALQAILIYTVAGAVACVIATAFTCGTNISANWYSLPGSVFLSIGIMADLHKGITTLCLAAVAHGRRL